jgi:hypothetical protein
MARNYIQTTLPAATLLPSARVVVSGGTSIGLADAATSQPATATLAAIGVTSAQIASGANTHGILGENPQGVVYTAGGTITQGAALVAQDTGAGAVIEYAATDYADTDEVVILGIAHEGASSGATFLGSFRPTRITVAK